MAATSGPNSGECTSHLRRRASPCRGADVAGIEGALQQAFAKAGAGRPLLVDVRVDYSKRTRFAEGIVRTHLGRFDLPTKARLVGRALWRRVTG
jgi:hypothetical protein